MLNLHEVKRVYICRHDYHINEDGEKCCVCEVVVDEEVAERLDSSYQLATIAEVNMCIEDLECEGGLVKVIETVDGIYGWYEIEFVDGLGDEEYFSDYMKIGMGRDEKVRDLAGMISRSKNK